jgi:hypothetical protein
VTQLKQDDPPTEYDPRRLKRFEDIGRSLKQLTSLVQTMHSVGVGPLFGSGPKQKANSVNRPLYVSIDLGLRQRRKHFHGQVYYQCTALTDNYFEQVRSGDEERETNETLLEFSGRGLKIAEGERLVSRPKVINTKMTLKTISIVSLLWFRLRRPFRRFSSPVSTTWKLRFGSVQLLYDSSNNQGKGSPLSALCCTNNIGF